MTTTPNVPAIAVPHQALDAPDAQRVFEIARLTLFTD